jgi:hypothetical protein
MKMPGFTADKSLYKARGHYRIAASVGAGVEILPQTILPQGWCKIGGRWVPCFLQQPDSDYFNASDFDKTIWNPCP